MDVDDARIGRRIREIRTWRGMSLVACAQLAGIAKSYLSMIERGERAITNRALLERLATVLRVDPAELTGRPYAPTDAQSSESHAAMAAVIDILMGWDVLQAEVVRLTKVLRPAADYAGQAGMLPELIHGLLVAAAVPAHRRAALVGLIDAYHAAMNVAMHLGVRGVPALAVERMRQAAEALDDPIWLTFAGWARAHALSGTNRARQYDLAVTVAEDPAARPEVRGMANLTAALASAAQRQTDQTDAHLDAAAELAETIEPDVSSFAHMQFGRTNVGIWRVAMSVELGQGGRVGEIAATVDPRPISKSRQCAFYIETGRGLLTERRNRERGLDLLLRAETLAPQQVRSNLFVREAVAGLLGTARRDAGGRELRGLAYRLGVAPKG
jgi:transcriptional regulator with XRE-family HTH domain